ncbi:MAG: hypothetical protein LBR12_02915 [Opitutaceae bacterium]|jgi:hypothetical protein|nr:hypothetical protein [Opitutaceae bacterium]
MSDTDTLLRRLNALPSPSAGPGFNAAVWRRIEHRRAQAAVPWWRFWPGAGPSLAAAAAALALAVAIGLSGPRPEAPARTAGGLGVFLPAPHTLFPPR